MKKLIATVVVAAAAAGLPLVAGCSSWGHHHEHDTGDRVQQVGVEDSPKAVRKAVARDYPGSSITRIERVREDDVRSYVVYLDTRNGDRREIRYSEDGNKLGKR